MGGVLVPRGEFGPFDVLSDIAHDSLINGFAERSVRSCRQWLSLTEAAGDVMTSRYLRYIEALGLQELGRAAETIDACERLLAELGDAREPVWRAKAMSVIAEAASHLGQHGRAIAALAEAEWMIHEIPEGTYGHLSASMAVALGLRSFNLMERADETLSRLGKGWSPEVDVLVAQERAMLSAYWGTALLLLGRGDEAAPHFVRCSSRAVALVRLAAATQNVQMVARGEVIEAYALMRLGQVPLAWARAMSAAYRFDARPELVETHLLRFVLARHARETGQYATASEHLRRIATEAEATRNDLWVATAQGALASVYVVEHGPHDGLDLWQTIARNALLRVWSEREARFAALRDRTRMRELRAETRRIGMEARHDHLTGLGNRRLLAEHTDPRDKDWAILVDVDQFKEINDTFSHAVGDAVLRAVADILRSVSREADLLVRYGGDEFLVVPAGDRDAAMSLAERIHRAVAARDWNQIAEGLTVTVSIGVGSSAADIDALAIADSALIAAKRAGRNRIVSR